MIPRRATYEVRVKISVILSEEGRLDPKHMEYGPFKCEVAQSWGGLAHLEFVGEMKAWKRWSVAAHAMRHLHDLIEDGTEVILYIEEKSWTP